MLKVVGKLGKLTNDCSKPTVTFPKRLWFGEDVGPFKVSGLALAAESLRQAFAEVQELDPDLFAALRTEGLLCVRARRTNPSRFSKHSWGTAMICSVAVVWY